MLFASSDSIDAPPVTLLKEDASTSTPSLAPDTLANQNDLAAWRDLFKARRSWTLEHVETAKRVAKGIQRHVDALRVMERGVGVAVGNLESHVNTLEHRYREAKVWADSLHREQRKILQSIDPSMRCLRALPGNRRYIQLLPLVRTPENVDSMLDDRNDIQLEDFIDAGRLKAAIQHVEADLSTFSDRTATQAKRVDDIVADASRLFEAVESTETASISHIENDASQLMEEIEVVAKKVASDCEHVLGLPNGQKSISQASKLALMHTRSYLPSLRDYCQGMNDITRKVVKQRNVGTLRTAKNMQQVAGVEATFAEVDAEVKSLDFCSSNDEAFALISLVTQLPFVYGALLLESIQRREWVDKIRGESANLAEDIAGYREEEERRRKKWAKNIGDVIAEDAATGTILNFELNLQAEEDPWPETSRDDVLLYIDALTRLEGQAEVVAELEAGVQDLDRPTRRQAKTARNFVNSSMHEAAQGKGSFLFRDNEEMKALKEHNLKLENDVKGQKSRVRKLEDLLYKQSQPRRSASSNLFQVPGTPPREPPTPDGGSPSAGFNESLPRQASTASRRGSSNLTGEDKTLARRIVGLEADLHQEKQRRLEVEKATVSGQDRTAQMVVELEESKSTTQDLMANLEAQQREFSGERRMLEEESNRHKSRAEELEDELDRLLGSRDNSKVIIEERTRSLETELQQANQALHNAQDDIRQREESREEHVRSLRVLHQSLSNRAQTPSSTADLINSLEEIAERTVRQMRDLSQTIAAAKSEKEDLQTLLDRKEKDSSERRQYVQRLEVETTNLANDLSTERARCTSLKEELEDGRRQLKSLRTKFAEGETGSEALRQRVEEQAARASTLAAELGKAQSHVNSLDVELSNLQRKHNALSSSASSNSNSLEQRSAKAKELTNRLVMYHQELPKLLESLGLSTMSRDGAMIIQRSSKIASQSTTLPDLSGSVSVMPATQPFDTSIDSSLSTWNAAPTGEEENQKFQDLLSRIDDFNLSTFSEAVIKLRRDVEWTGKKWKMEARGYRDKHLRSQNEAHDKIAIRGFKEGDLALFLPTRNQATRPWAAFNVGAPHYFLREQESHNLRHRDWLVARITKIEERVVDLSKTMSESLRAADRRSLGETSDGGTSIDDDNPFELSDGLRWYLIDAVEDKAGAPSTPGLGKSTVASANVDVKGSIRMKKASANNDASTKLNKSLQSRRSSSNSKRGSISGAVGGRDSTNVVIGGSPTLVEGPNGPTKRLSASHLRPGSRSSASGGAAGPSSLGVEVMNKDPSGARLDGAADEVRKDQLWGP